MKYRIILLVSLLCITCNNSIKRDVFYNNGNVKECRIYTNKKDTTTYFITKYYFNGQISEKGFIKDGYKEGTWEYWYSDGKTRWVGVFSQNNHIYSVDSFPVVSFYKDTLCVGKKTYLRVQSKSTPMEYLVIGCSNGIIQNADNKELYDFMLIPEHKGILNLYFSDRRLETTMIKQTFMVY
jgi:hypothetical protein